MSPPSRTTLSFPNHSRQHDQNQKPHWQGIRNLIGRGIVKQSPSGRAVSVRERGGTKLKLHWQNVALSFRPKYSSCEPLARYTVARRSRMCLAPCPWSVEPGASGTTGCAIRPRSPRLEWEEYLLKQPLPDRLPSGLAWPYRDLRRPRGFGIPRRCATSRLPAE